MPIDILGKGSEKLSAAARKFNESVMHRGWKQEEHFSNAEATEIAVRDEYVGSEQEDLQGGKYFPNSYSHMYMPRNRFCLKDT